MTFLWVIVVLMAIALAAEIFALVGIAMVGVGALRKAKEFHDEFSGKLSPTVRLLRDLKTSLQPRMESIHREGKAIGELWAPRMTSIQAAWKDFDSRRQRIKVRYQSDGMRTLRQVQHSKDEIRVGVVRPLGKVVRIGEIAAAAIWLLRKVA